MRSEVVDGLRALVVGGSLAGLTSALALARIGAQVTVVERAAGDAASGLGLVRRRPNRAVGLDRRGSRRGRALFHPRLRRVGAHLSRAPGSSARGVVRAVVSSYHGQRPTPRHHRDPDRRVRPRPAGPRTCGTGWQRRTRAHTDDRQQLRGGPR